jgi:hypothetical protein
MVRDAYLVVGQMWPMVDQEAARVPPIIHVMLPHVVTIHMH